MLYAFGDIHGCFNSLKTIFNAGIFKPEDTLIFLGDYVDRGPDSKSVINFLLKLKTQYHCEFIMGNHELMMLSARINNAQLDRWLYFGGSTVIRSYGIKSIDSFQNWDQKIDSSHWQFLENCKSYYTQEDYIFVHAGLDPDKSLEEQNLHDLHWKKYEIPAHYTYDTSKTVICGHTSRKNGEIADFKHTICIDTYCYGGQWLTCLNVETGEFWKANEKGKLELGRLQNRI